MDRCEFAHASQLPESMHRPLSSSHRLMRVRNSIVEPAAGVMPLLYTKSLQGCRIRAQAICDDYFRLAIALHRVAQKSQCGISIPRLSDVRFQHLAFVINGTPEVKDFSVDLYK